MSYSLKNITNKIIQMEKEYKLFELKINDIYFWKKIRVQLLNEISKKLNLYDEAHTKRSISRLEKTKRILRNKKGLDEIKIAFFISDRFFEENGKYYEMYSYDILNKEQDKSIVYPNFIDLKYYTQEFDCVSEESIQNILKVLKIKIKNKVYKLKKTEEVLIINKIKLELENYFNINLLETLSESNIKKTVISFTETRKYYLDFLRLKSCRKVYLVCSYGREELISAAQELGIEVIEIQHGVMNKYHLGYHFPNNKVIPYFPDKLIMFGDYWYNNTSIPLTREQIEFNGYPYLEKQLNRYKGRIIEQENTVLFISQGTIGRKFTEKAIEFAKDNPDKKIIIRLHPGEFSRWKTEYEVLYKNRNLSNVEISDNNAKNLYEYIFECEYIICVYSTVIYEALHLEKKIGVIDLPGVEYVEDLIIEKSLIKYSIDEEIDLNKIEKLNKTSKRFFESVN